jgi:putative lipoic acid-binding regulatory protein
MCDLNLKKQMEPCRLRLEVLGMMRQNLVDQLRELV